MKKLLLMFMISTVLFIFPNVALAGNIATNLNDNEAGAYANNYSDPTYNGINIEAGEPIRGFINPNGVGFSAVPSFFGPDTQGPTYQRVELLLPLKSEWKRYELNASVTETDIMFRCRYFMKTRKVLIKELEKRTKSDFFDPLKSSLKEKSHDTIYIITAPPKGEFKMIGHITLWAKDKYTTSFELQSKACLLALELPTAKAILIMSQGCEKRVETSGWGASIGNSTATINSTQDVSTVTSPALGYSTGEAGNTGRPWLQVAIIQ